MTTSASTGNVRFEGMGVGTEIWGATQANFLVLVPPQHAKEAAVLLNDPAAKQLASALGVEDGEAFRAEAARALGELYLEDRLRAGKPIESVTTLSHAFFAERPDLFEAAQAALRK
ncbi:MAG: hypothetical protein U0837_09645 [Dehalococcoidia bacterium]